MSILNTIYLSWVYYLLSFAFLVFFHLLWSYLAIFPVCSLLQLYSFLLENVLFYQEVPLPFKMYLYLNSTHSFYIYNALQYVILPFTMNLGNFLVSVLFLWKLFSLPDPILSPFFFADPWFPCPSVSFSDPVCGLLPVQLCIWVMLYSHSSLCCQFLFLSRTWCLGFPFKISSHLRAKKYSCSPERKLGAGIALPLLQKAVWRIAPFPHRTS